MGDRAFQRTITRGVAWVGLASSLVAAFELIALALILQRWATKEDYGTISVVITMFGALQLVGEAGLPAALVQRAHTGDERVSTMYWLVVLAGLALYGMIWAVAPALAAAYELPMLTPLFRVVGLLLVIRPLYTTHQALLRRELRFREMSIVRVVANTIELAVKLAVASAGGGPWAFAFGPLARELTFAIGVPWISRWRPRLICRPRLVRDDFRFGLRSTGGEVLFQVYSNLDYQVVGYAFGPAALGVYRAAYELVLEPVRFVSGVITIVAFPTFARLRTDRTALIEQFITFTRHNLAIVLLMVGVIAVGADDLLVLTYGASYGIASTAARILAIVAMFRAMSYLGPPLLDGVGRPELTLRYQAIASGLLATLFVGATWLGTDITSVAVAWAIGYPLAFAVLWRMVLGQLQLPLGVYLRRVGRIVVVVAIAVGAGIGVRLTAAGLDPPLRLACTATTVIVLASLLLARVEGLSVRAAMRSLQR